MSRYRLPRRGVMVAPPPPVSNPRTCRWCGLARHLVKAGDLAYLDCPNGCQANDAEPIYPRVCMDCGAEFRSGYSGALLCASCDDAEAGKVTREQRATGHIHRGYLSDDIARGADVRSREGK